MVKILVTGATGLNGRQIVEHLRSLNADVRALVRSEAKAGPLKALGAEVVVADLDRPESLEKAFHGVERAVLLAPSSTDFVKLFENGVHAAKKAGVKFIVKFSAAGADPKSSAALAAKHGQSEEIVKDSGIDWTIVQPNFFADNFGTFDADNIKKYGTFTGAAGDGKMSFITSNDISNTIAHILVHPGNHKHKTYLLTGPEAIDEYHVAKILSEAIGKPVHYNNLPEEEYHKTIKSWGLPENLIEDLLFLESVKRNNWGSEVTHHVKHITGKAPETFQEWAHKNENLFK